MKIDDMKNALLLARKMKDSEKVLSLSTIVGELTANAKLINGEKIVSDEDCHQLIKKFVKSLDEMISLTNSSKLKREKDYLESFLPNQLTIDEMKELFEKINPESIKDWMSYLKEHHPGRYDGKIASQIMKG